MKEQKPKRSGREPLQPLPQHQARSTSQSRAVAAPCPIRFTRAICGDLVQAERREWWIANGLGAYAGGTIAGSLTRRYHGLLIAPIASPLGRRLILAKADATVIEGPRSWPLFTNRWKSGAISPAGYIRIGSFHLDYSVPVWTYEIGEHRIEARIWMEPGAHTTYTAWRLWPQSEPPEHELSMRVTLLANHRDHHGTTAVGAFAPEIAVEHERLELTDAGFFSLTIRAPNGTIVPKRDWYQDFDLPSKPSAASSRPTITCAWAKSRCRSCRDNGAALLQASTRTCRAISTRRSSAVLIMTARSSPPRPPAVPRCTTRRHGSLGLRWPPTPSLLPGR